MGKSIKFRNDIYLDTRSIAHNNVLLSNILNYSKDEVKIGKWVNGKNLYRKVLDFDYFPDNSQRFVPIYISNLDDVCWYEYSWFDTVDDRFFSGLRFDTGTTYCKVAISSTDLIVEGKGTEWSKRTSNGKCIIYYTKKEE